MEGSMTAGSRPAEAAIAALRDLLGDRLTTATALREQHSRGEDLSAPVLPDAVAFPHSTEEVSRLLAICNAHGVPVVPFGAGTSLEGHVTPWRGGISLDLSRMDRVIEVNDADMDCLVEPGVTRQALNALLRDRGLFFPVDPGSHATIGGMCATRASGTNAVRYGTMRENVLGLEAVLADGRVISAGGRTRKSASGYDLTRLLLGSEGTLAVITRARLRLFGIPEAISAAVVQFEDLGGAVRTVIETLHAGIPVARIELLDEVQMAACIAYSRLEGYAARPTLFVEFHGTEASVAEQAESLGGIAAGQGGSGFAWAREQEARTRLWEARHNAYWAATSLLPGSRAYTTDICVPISALEDAILGARRDIADSGLTAPIVGHVGDGNFHAAIVVRPGDEEALRRAWALDRKIVARGLALGGTCSGEHGIGIHKREFLEAEHGAAALDVMRMIKVALDPRGILNPGKLLPE
jgi:D-lactate dehydrogenase (cytochrome)